MNRLFFIYGLLMLANGFYSETNASQTKPSLPSAMTQRLEETRVKEQRWADEAALKKIEPTLEQIKDNSIPWGVNLERLRERRVKVRPLPGGADDFSSKITLYQRNKPLIQGLKEDQSRLMAELKKAKVDLASKNPVKLYRRPKTRKRIQELQKEMGTLTDKLATYDTIMRALERTIGQTTGLTVAQITRLPAYDGSKTPPIQLRQPE